jgi:hypothetical protein
MNEIKERVFRLFDSGEFRKAIVGDEDFFFKDDLWGDHDSTSIFLWLFDWLKEQGNNNQTIEKIKTILKDRLEETREVSDIDGSLIAIILVRSYCIAAAARKFWPINKDFIINLLNDYIERFSVEENKRFNIQRDMKEFNEKYLPKIIQK